MIALVSNWSFSDWLDLIGILCVFVGVVGETLVPHRKFPDSGIKIPSDPDEAEPLIAIRSERLRVWEEKKADTVHRFGLLLIFGLAPTAFLKFQIEATNVVRAEALAETGMGSHSAGTLILTRRSEPQDNVAAIALMAGTFGQFENEITMELTWWSHMRRIAGANQNETCEQLISELNRGLFSGMLFKDGRSVSNASLSLVLNGTVRKEFTLGAAHRPPDGWPGVMFNLIEGNSMPVK